MNLEDLLVVKTAIDTAIETYEGACDCGECEPCTDGMALLLQAKEILSKELSSTRDWPVL